MYCEANCWLARECWHCQMYGRAAKSELNESNHLKSKNYQKAIVEIKNILNSIFHEIRNLIIFNEIVMKLKFCEFAVWWANEASVMPGRER
jgi:hypothetical protein